jgi:hypothetical protein
MSKKPLDPYSEVVDAKQRWTPEWYTWLQSVSSDSAKLENTVAGIISGSVPVPPLLNYLGGLILSNNSTTPATVLNIGTGSACSDNNTTMMTLSAANFTKNCNAAWAVGSGNGALDSGSIIPAAAWLHLFVIMNTSSGSVDVLASQSATSPTMPSGYTVKRRVGSIVTSSSAILGFSQLGDEFLWKAPVLSISSALPTVATLVAFNVPIGIKVLAKIQGYFNDPTASGQLFIYSPDQSQPPTGLSVAPANPFYDNVDTIVRTNISGQVFWLANTAGATANLSTIGWYDYRGK